MREGKASGRGRSSPRHSQVSGRACADLCGASLGIVCCCDTRRGLASTPALRGKGVGSDVLSPDNPVSCVEAHGWQSQGCSSQAGQRAQDALLC